MTPDDNLGDPILILHNLASSQSDDKKPISKLSQTTYLPTHRLNQLILQINREYLLQFRIFFPDDHEAVAGSRVQTQSVLRVGERQNGTSVRFKFGGKDV
jgi:hypothetical protein